MHNTNNHLSLSKSIINLMKNIIYQQISLTSKRFQGFRSVPGLCKPIVPRSSRNNCHELECF